VAMIKQNKKENKNNIKTTWRGGYYKKPKKKTKIT
jgi:hypothetical protein